LLSFSARLKPRSFKASLPFKSLFFDFPKNFFAAKERRRRQLIALTLYLKIAPVPPIA
jgi:hypothetical protein